MVSHECLQTARTSGQPTSRSNADLGANGGDGGRDVSLGPFGGCREGRCLPGAERLWGAWARRDRPGRLIGPRGNVRDAVGPGRHRHRCTRMHGGRDLASHASWSARGRALARARGRHARCAIGACEADEFHERGVSGDGGEPQPGGFRLALPQSSGTVTPGHGVLRQSSRYAGRARAAVKGAANSPLMPSRRVMFRRASAAKTIARASPSTG